MSSENLPLRLKLRAVRTTSGGESYAEDLNGTMHLLSRDHAWLAHQALAGSTLAQLAEVLLNEPKQSFTGRSYRVLAGFLTKMGEQGWLADPTQQTLAESLDSDYRWPESTIYQELTSLELLRTREKTPAVGAAREARLAAFVLTQIFLLAGCLVFVANEKGGSASAFLLWASLFLVFSLGKSFRALSQFFAKLLFTSSKTQLILRLDVSSLALSAGDASLADGVNTFYLLATIASLTALIWGGALVATASVAAAVPVGVFVWLLLLVELSPFRQSALTETLRVLFLYLEQRPKAETSPELAILILQRMAGVVWGLSLLGFLISNGPTLASLISQVLQSNTAIDWASALLFVLSLLMAMLAVIDDLWSGIFPSADLKILRRRFRRAEGFRNRLNKTIEDADRRSLEDLPLFRQLGSLGRIAMLDRENLQRCDFEKGEKICREGETDRALFVLLAGSVSVAKNKAGRQKLVTILEAGAVFGEAAFFLGQARTADVTALEDCRVMKIAHHSALQDLSPDRSASLQLRIWFLQALMRNELFRNLPAEAFDALLFAGERVEFKPGEKIMSEGELGQDCFFIVQGEARVIQNLRELRRLKAGDSFGEIALLRPGFLRTASIVAESSIIAVRAEGTKFRNLLCSHLPLAVEIEKLAAERLRNDRLRSGS